MCVNGQTGQGVANKLQLTVAIKVVSRNGPDILHRTRNLRGNVMKKLQHVLKRAAILTLFISLVGCAGMSRQGQGTLLGAGIGGIGGAALTNGSPLGTLGGAAVGGLLGNVISKPAPPRYRPRYRGRYRR